MSTRSKRKSAAAAEAQQDDDEEMTGNNTQQQRSNATTRTSPRRAAASAAVSAAASVDEVARGSSEAAASVTSATTRGKRRRLPEADDNGPTNDIEQSNKSKRRRTSESIVLNDSDDNDNNDTAEAEPENGETNGKEKHGDEAEEDTKVAAAAASMEVEMPDAGDPSEGDANAEDEEMEENETNQKMPAQQQPRPQQQAAIPPAEDEDSNQKIPAQPQQPQASLPTNGNRLDVERSNVVPAAAAVPPVANLPVLAMAAAAASSAAVAAAALPPPVAGNSSRESDALAVQNLRIPSHRTPGKLHETARIRRPRTLEDQDENGGGDVGGGGFTRHHHQQLHMIAKPPGAASDSIRETDILQNGTIPPPPAPANQPDARGGRFGWSSRLYGYVADNVEAIVSPTRQQQQQQQAADDDASEQEEGEIAEQQQVDQDEAVSKQLRRFRSGFALLLALQVLCTPLLGITRPRFFRLSKKLETSYKRLLGTAPPATSTNNMIPSAALEQAKLDEIKAAIKAKRDEERKAANSRPAPRSKKEHAAGGKSSPTSRKKHAALHELRTELGNEVANLTTERQKSLVSKNSISHQLEQFLQQEQDFRQRTEQKSEDLEKAMERLQKESLEPLAQDQTQITKMSETIQTQLAEWNTQWNDGRDAVASKQSSMKKLTESLLELSKKEHPGGTEKLQMARSLVGDMSNLVLIDVSALELWNVAEEEDERCAANFALVEDEDSHEVVEEEVTFLDWQDFDDEFENTLDEFLHALVKDEELEGIIEEWLMDYVESQPALTLPRKASPPKKKSLPVRTGGHSRSYVKNLIASRIELDRADQTSKRDYAAIFNGASVIRVGEHATSPSLVDALPLWNRLHALWRLRFYGHGPEAALTPTHPPTALGQCWSFGKDPNEDASTYARLSVNLAKPVRVVSISVEHPAQAISDKRRSAIRSFHVLGFEDVDAQGAPWKLGYFEYNIHDAEKGTRHEFQVNDEDENGYYIPELRSVSLVIQRNWGMQYSCLYRFRVHGIER